MLKNRRLAEKLLDLYGTPDNIDIWVGGVAEPLVERGRVGSLLACLLGKQFQQIRDGDRQVRSREEGWGEQTLPYGRPKVLCEDLPRPQCAPSHLLPSPWARGAGGPPLGCVDRPCFCLCRFWWESPGVFTEKQRDSLQKMSFSRLVCDNTHITKVPRDPFQANSYPQDFVDCSAIDKLDLSPWASVEN